MLIEVSVRRGLNTDPVPARHSHVSVETSDPLPTLIGKYPINMLLGADVATAVCGYLLDGGPPAVARARETW
jgi:hypothetical protein